MVLPIDVVKIRMGVSQDTVTDTAVISSLHAPCKRMSAHHHLALYRNYIDMWLTLNLKKMPDPDTKRTTTSWHMYGIETITPQLKSRTEEDHLQ